MQKGVILQRFHHEIKIDIEEKLNAKGCQPAYVLKKQKNRSVTKLSVFDETMY